MLRWFLLIVLITSPVLAGEPVRDRDGFPLPPGAVARLGTTRLRLNTDLPGVGSVALSQDGSRVACVEIGHIHVWDGTTGKLLHRFDFPHRPARCDAL